MQQTQRVADESTLLIRRSEYETPHSISDRFWWCLFVPDKRQESDTLELMRTSSVMISPNPDNGSSDEHPRPLVACTNCKSVSLCNEIVIDIAISAIATPARSRIARCPRLPVGVNHSPGAKFEPTCYVILDVLRKRDERIALGQLIRTALTSLTHVAERGLVDHSVAVSFMCCRPTLAR